MTEEVPRPVRLSPWLTAVRIVAGIALLLFVFGPELFAMAP
jgi:hypothetical protein